MQDQVTNVMAFGNVSIKRVTDDDGSQGYDISGTKEPNKHCYYRGPSQTLIWKVRGVKAL